MSDEHSRDGASDSASTGDSAKARILNVVSAIPKGCVCAYGQVASMAGVPNGHRQVGRVLSQLPKPTRIPWHRVLNHKGCISFPSDSQNFARQRERLIAEGVLVVNGRVSMREHQWRP